MHNVDALLEIAMTTQDTGRRNLCPFTDLVEKYAAILECLESKEVKQRCYIMLTIPELTVCEERYQDVIVPDVQGVYILPHSLMDPCSRPQGSLANYTLRGCSNFGRKSRLRMTSNISSRGFRKEEQRNVKSE